MVIVGFNPRTVIKERLARVKTFLCRIKVKLLLLNGWFNSCLGSTHSKKLNSVKLFGSKVVFKPISSRMKKNEIAILSFQDLKGHFLSLIIARK